MEFDQWVLVSSSTMRKVDYHTGGDHGAFRIHLIYLNYSNTWTEQLRVHPQDVASKAASAVYWRARN